MTIQSDPVVLAQRFLFALARLAAKRRGATFGTPVIDPAGGVLYVPCSDGIVALRVRGASFSPPWHSTGFTPGPPIVAAGLVWDASRGGSLRALDLSNGQVRYQAGQGYWVYLSGSDALDWPVAPRAGATTGRVKSGGGKVGLDWPPVRAAMRVGMRAGILVAQ